MFGTRGLLHAHGFARQCAGDEYRFTGLHMLVWPAGHATTIVDQVGDVQRLRGVIETGHGKKCKRMAAYCRRLAAPFREFGHNGYPWRFATPDCSYARVDQPA